MMKFYMTPGSCSTGIHILLEEIGLVFEAHVVNLQAGDQDRPEYRAINPKGTIPSLVLDDGSALTDWQAIAWWLAKQHPRRKLLPESLAGEIRVLEAMNYAVNTLHGQGFTRIFTTERYCANPAEHAAIREQGREIIEQGFALFERQLAGLKFVADSFSIADAALFYVEFWAVKSGIALPPHCQAHYQSLLSRPAVRQVLAEEGYSSALR